MDARELRIGNYTDKGVIRSFIEYGIHVGFGKTYQFSELNPIPITDQWLLDFKFQKSYSREFYWNGVVKIQTYKKKPGYRVIIGGKRVFVEFVHHLQNIHHAISGIELTKKP